MYKYINLIFNLYAYIKGWFKKVYLNIIILYIFIEVVIILLRDKRH